LRAEKTLKDWVRAHPGAQFQPYGKAMTKARKREVKAWETEVRKVKRENQLAREQERFKSKWEKKWGESPVLPVKSGKRRQRTYKLRARKARKARMGHPEKVLKNVV
jgi:recombinational DNA repair ATPase RecF